MPKKSRKAKVRASQRPINPGYGTKAAIPLSTVEPARDVLPSRPGAAPVAAVGRVAGASAFDYGYVYRDLRRIGLLAAAFFLVMFALWFVVEVQGIHLIPGVF